MLTGHDAHRFEALHRAMPGVARAATPDVPAEEATRAALDHIADALVRETLAGPLLERRGDGVVHAWLGALTGTDAVIDGDAGRRPLAAAHLDRWAEGVTPAPVRTCFRLSHVDEFPGEDAGRLAAGVPAAAGRRARPAGAGARRCGATPRRR